MKKSNNLNDGNDVSLLEEVVREKQKEEMYFDFMIDNERDFNIALVTMPDDYIIHMHDYYLRLERRESFLVDEGESTPRLDRMRGMISKLEEIPVIQEHMNKKLSEEEEAEINASVAAVVEKQKVKNMGPIRRKIYNFYKNRK